MAPMRKVALLATALLGAHLRTAVAVTLRKPAAVVGAVQKTAAGQKKCPVQQPARNTCSKLVAAKRSCAPSVSLLAKKVNASDLPTQLGAGGGNYKDGYSRVTCDVDSAPETQRIHFKEHACGAVKSCRLTELPMEPQLCFDFCRQYEDAKFFGIAHGVDCYCSKYFHAKSLGGSGECTYHCEGNKEEMCGGKGKSSLFEMHLCADSGSEADIAVQIETESRDKAEAVIEKGTTTMTALHALGQAWQLDVCSSGPEGGRVCALSQAWSSDAARLNEAIQKVEHAADVLAKKGAALTAATTANNDAGGNDATLAGKMEVATTAVRDTAAKASGIAAAGELSINTLAGPIGGDSLASFTDVFKPLGDVENDWHAVCALAPIPGQYYAAMAADAPAACGNHCLSLSTGVDMCVGFNYQYRDGLASCQFLKSEGIVEPSDSLSKAVPVFEVSTSKRDAMGISSLGCYTHGAFMGGQASGTGPLETKVLREVSSSGGSGEDTDAKDTDAKDTDAKDTDAKEEK